MKPLELEDSPYLPSFEKIRRRKPELDEGEPRIYLPHPNLRRASIPDIFNQVPLSEWPEFRKMVEGWNGPIQRSILQMFIANNGPMSVARGIKQELELIRNDIKVPDETSTLLIEAYGTVFERLACYWMKTITGESRRVLDVGSAQRVAQAFRRNSGIHIMPDGLIINNKYNPPLLEAACEYKTNPNSPNSSESLERQIGQLEDFFTRFGNQTLRARGRDRFHLDIREQWTVREIQIAERPSIVLVIPEDRDYHPSNEFVRVWKAPFLMSELGKIVFTLLRDIRGIGFIEQELMLLEERRQMELLKE